MKSLLITVCESTAWTLYRPLSRGELFAKFDVEEGRSKYLLIHYSLVIGLRAKVAIDLGVGQTAGAIRAAAAQTGATVYESRTHIRSFFSSLQNHSCGRLLLQSTA